MKFYVAVTDNDWYKNLATSEPDEVNFWRPGGQTVFRAILQGSPFLFKLHSPLNYIAGGGFFIKFERFPISFVWEAFGEKNGALNFLDFLNMIRKHRKDYAIDPVIGCIVLAEPFFFKEEWIPVPENWSPSIQQGKTYDTEEYYGKKLWNDVKDRMYSYNNLWTEHLISGNVREIAKYLVTTRLRQGSFRTLVTSAYHKRCAISGEKVLPILQAAHIKPYAETGPNRVNNGLLLRSDFHILFDKGYVTVTPDYTIEVSRAIKEEFDNGKNYYPYHGRRLFKLPDSDWEKPSSEYLTWHNDNLFIG